MKTISFFGHRQIFKSDIVQKNIVEILKAFLPQGYSRILVGCHGDFDRLVLSSCINYKKIHQCDLKISVVLTSLSFLNKDYFGLSKADIYRNMECETIFYDIENIHFKNRITFSNKKMVDESDLIICYVDMNMYKSGAKTAVRYALKNNKKVINLFEIINNA